MCLLHLCPGGIGKNTNKLFINFGFPTVLLSYFNKSEPSQDSKQSGWNIYFNTQLMYVCQIYR